MKLLFVCHGNICRSPMAEFVMLDLLKTAGLSDRVHVASAATSREELGNPVHPGTKRKLAENGISCKGKTARQMTRADYDAYDLLICMDSYNLRNMQRITGGDPENKMCKLLSFCGEDRDVADPWYTGDFDATWHDVMRGCTALLKQLCDENRWTMKRR